MCNATAWRGEAAVPDPVGRILCYDASDGPQWVEWTNQPLLIFAQANSPSAAVLFNWWRSDTGPV